MRVLTPTVTANIILASAQALRRVGGKTALPGLGVSNRAALSQPAAGVSDRADLPQTATCLSGCLAGIGVIGAEGRPRGTAPVGHADGLVRRAAASVLGDTADREGGLTASATGTGY